MFWKKTKQQKEEPRVLLTHEEAEELKQYLREHPEIEEFYEREKKKSLEDFPPYIAW